MAIAPIIGIASAIGAVTSVASGIAKMVHPGPPDPRQKMNPQGQDVANDLAHAYANNVTGIPKLGGGLGLPTVPPPNLDLNSIKQRLNNVGQNLGVAPTNNSPVGPVGSSSPSGGVYS